MKQEVIDKLNPASSAEAKASQSIEIMSNLQYLIAMRQYKTGQDKAVGEKLAPYKNSIQRLGMAYDIIAYPLLEETGDGLAIREAVRDAQESPNKNTQEYPHRTPFKLNEEEVEILGQLARTTGLPFDPKKQVYSYTELSARRDAYNQAAMNSYMARKARQNTIDAGMVRKRSDIKKEIRQRRIRPLPSETKPSDPKK